MEAYVKESLYVLDYDNNIKDAIFLSDDHMTPGYAYDITITEANTGYSDLKFTMPNMIIDDEGNKVLNPKLALLTPLVKLRYHRQVYYMGDTTIKVREPVGYGDVVEYVDKEYKNTYPDNIIEDYVMDYIVQPIDRKRDVLKLTTAFTAIDYPRFTLSKKKVGLTITQDTLAADPEWSLFENKPIDVNGAIHYELWTAAKYSQYSDIEEWDPANAYAYPLSDERISDLIHNTATWTYGMLGTAFYWPIVSTGRFEGTMYTKGGYLVLQLYDYYSIVTEGVEPEKHVDRYGWEWSYLEEVDKYLAPNNALNYLRHILDGTKWTVALREDGTPDVDIEMIEVPNPDGSAVPSETKAHTCNINISGSNCYNAITTVCQSLQLYPVFNCEDRTVALRLFSGKNHGLVYRLGTNLTSNGIKNDGEKVITKLYVTGGNDNKGNQNINIGEAERSYFEPTDNPDERDPWNPNDPEYIIKRSPYGTNYILNFKWMYENKWITKEQILGIYSINQQINDLNKGFMPAYTQDRQKVLEMYYNAINDYDLKQGEYISTLNSMMNKYYKVYGEYSKGTFYAFHKAPLGTHKAIDPKDGKTKNFLWVAHCKKCGWTKSYASKPAACECGHDVSQMDLDEIYIPVYKDFEGTVTPPANPQYPYGPALKGFEYEPYLKGDYLKLVTTLDNENGNWSITDYESRVSLVTPIAFREGTTIDDREYYLDGVYVKASSGNILEWNQDIALFVQAYGAMLDARDKIDYCLLKIEQLDEQYKEWKEEYNGYHAQIQELYGDYIVEGNYTNNEQPYVGLLFREGMEASDRFAIPEVTYNLDVIDSSGLIEYRMPMVTKYACGKCDYESYEKIEVCPECGHDLILRMHDTYNDLVQMLHSIGQIVPKAGDYVIIYDEPMGLFGVPGTITEISRTLDKPMQNKIKLDTGYTDDEELVGNIINATNTVLSHKDIYARTAVLKADGTIDSQSIARTLDNPNANVSIIGTNGNMLLTGSYLRFTNPVDPTQAIKYSGTGMFTTTSLNENGVATEWQKLVTPTGINATYINAGQIDVKNVSIMSGMSSKILMDQYGLVVKDQANKSAHILPFSTDLAKLDADYAGNWGTNNNISGFVGVDPNNNALIYTKGFLVANEGSNIANWITSNEGFYHLDGTKKDLWLSPGGINATVNGSPGNFAFYANGNFGVTTDGTLHASGVTVNGKIVCDSNSTINGNLGKVSADSVTLSSAGVTGTVNGSSGPWAIYSKGNFGVTTGGILWATGAHIKGDIYADSGTFNGTVYASGGSFTGTVTANAGTIGGCTIEDGVLQIKNANIDTIAVSKVTGGTNNKNITFSGGITCTNLTAKSSGNIGGWTINGTDGFKNNNSAIHPNGNMELYPQSGAGAEYIFNNGMTLHSTAAQNITSGANIAITASTNLNLASGSGSYTRIQGGLGIRINGRISVSTSYDGERDTTEDWSGVIHVDGKNKQFKFVNGLLVSVTDA